MYLVLSLIVDPYVGGPAVPSAHAYVKYVRVWQQPNGIFTFLLGPDAEASSPVRGVRRAPRRQSGPLRYVCPVR